MSYIENYLTSPSHVEADAAFRACALENTLLAYHRSQAQHQPVTTILQWIQQHSRAVVLAPTLALLIIFVSAIGIRIERYQVTIHESQQLSQEARQLENDIMNDAVINDALNS
jgi:hypothetical protein